jgi:coenzyme F420-reducing hydrogenase beta subunit
LCFGNPINLFFYSVELDNENMQKKKSSFLGNKKLCCGCSACVNVCPSNAIKMEAGLEGFLYPKVDFDKCVNCGQCLKACPYEHKNKKSETHFQYFAFRTKNHDLLECSSGGFCNALCSETVDNGGVVFGCSFNKDMVAKHIKVVTREDLGLLRGSKYVQSEIGLSFRDVKASLEAKKDVLFVGTPCQIEGLLLFLHTTNCNRERLTTISIACHGVPSNRLFQLYLKTLTPAGDRIKEFRFRSKDSGWNGYSLKVTFSDQTSRLIPQMESPYFVAFLQNLSLRRSCFDCPSKKNLYGDFLVGDFWGIESIDNSFSDDIGTSLVIPLSAKARGILSSFSNEALIHLEQSPSPIKGRNEYLFKSVPFQDSRKTFLQTVNEKNFSEAVRYAGENKTKHALPSVLKKIIRKIVHH